MALPLAYYVIFILAVLEVMLFGGIIHGWASLVYVLKEDGYYGNLCQGNETLEDAELTTSMICDRQDANLNLVYTIGASMPAAFLFITGLLFDRFGTRVCRIFTHFVLVSGLLLMIISDPSKSDLLFPGMLCIAVGGASHFLTLAQVGNLFGRHRSTVITIISGSFDASAVVMLFVKLSYEHGASLDTSFAVLTGISSILFINSFCLLPTGRIPWPLPSNYRGNNKEDTNADPALPSESNNESEVALSRWSSASNNGDKVQIISKKDDRSNAERYRNNDFPTLKACILSPSFMLLLLWFAILQLKIHSFFGTINPLLVQLTNENDKLVNHYTKVFSFIQFGGVLTSPLSGMILDRNKGQTNRQPYDDLKDSALGFAFTTGVHTLFALFNTVPILEVQYVTFVLQIVSRSFLYATFAAALYVMFPQRYYGTLFGSCFIIASIIDLLQYPLFIMTQRFFDNNFLVMNVVLLIACASTFVLPIYVTYYAAKKNKELQGRNGVNTG